MAGLVFVAPALPAKADSQGESFIWKASLGQQLQRLYFRALLQNDQAGLNYVRARIQERSAEVALGKGLNILGEGAEVPQVSPLTQSSCHKQAFCKLLQQANLPTHNRAFSGQLGNSG